MKKWIKFFLCWIMLLTFSSCHQAKTYEKFLLEGDATLTGSINLESVSALQEMVENDQSFVLVLKVQSCSSCNQFYKDALNPYIEETHAKIYSLNGVLLDDYPSFANKPSFRISPTLVLYQEGNIVSTLAYNSKNDAFTTKKGLKSYLEQYVIEPRLISLSEELIQQKIENKEDFVLYIGWYRCGDCSKLNEYVLKDYLKNKDVTLYYLESDFYRKNKPTSKPIEPANDASQEEIEAYAIALQNWNLWIEFATKYEFVSYRDGKVPAILFYQQGMANDWLIYRNDIINDLGVVEESFFHELIGQKLTEEELLNYHNQQAIRFLNNHLSN